MTKQIDDDVIDAGFKVIDDGGPEIPTNPNLSDYFAGQALMGQAAFEGMEGCDPHHWAAMAYELADAMLKARQS